MSNDAHPGQSENWYREQARRFHDEGVIEIDDGAPVSQADGNPDRGAYVQAWIWIEDPPSEQDALKPEHGGRPER